MACRRRRKAGLRARGVMSPRSSRGRSSASTTTRCATLRSAAIQRLLPLPLVEDLDVAEPRAAGEDNPRRAVHRGALLLLELADQGGGAHLDVHPLGHQ